MFNKLKTCTKNIFNYILDLTNNIIYFCRTQQHRMSFKRFQAKKLSEKMKSNEGKYKMYQNKYNHRVDEVGNYRPSGLEMPIGSGVGGFPPGDFQV